MPDHARPRRQLKFQRQTQNPILAMALNPSAAQKSRLSQTSQKKPALWLHHDGIRTRASNDRKGLSSRLAVRPSPDALLRAKLSSAIAWRLESID